MRPTFDFQIVATDKPGMSLVMSMNEDAFSYITDEAELDVLPDGSAPIFDFNVRDFVETSEQHHLCSVIV